MESCIVQRAFEAFERDGKQRAIAETVRASGDTCSIRLGTFRTVRTQWEEGTNMKSVVSAVAIATALASGVSAFVTPSSRTTSTDASQLLPPADENYVPVDSTRASYYPFGASISSDRSISLSARPPKSNEEVTDGSANVRQLLGLKGASETTDIWKIRLQLTKPVTWIPLVWGVMCGAAASGNYHWIWNPFDPNDRDVMLGLEDTAKGFVAMILAGPFLTGYTQTINDWYDREIDAINEPYRPIPSGAISEGQGMFISVLFVAS